MSKTESAAIQACRHILERVRRDSDFAWYMLATEGLRQCIDAVANASGDDPELLYRKIHDAGDAVIKREQPRVKALEAERDKLQAAAIPSPVNDATLQVLAMYERGEAKSHLSDLLHYCRMRGENPTVEAIETALSGKGLARCLCQMESV